MFEIKMEIIIKKRMWKQNKRLIPESGIPKWLLWGVAVEVFSMTFSKNNWNMECIFDSDYKIILTMNYKSVHMNHMISFVIQIKNNVQKKHWKCKIVVGYILFILKKLYVYTQTSSLSLAKGEGKELEHFRVVGTSHCQRNCIKNRTNCLMFYLFFQKLRTAG